MPILTIRRSFVGLFYHANLHQVKDFMKSFCHIYLWNEEFSQPLNFRIAQVFVSAFMGSVRNIYVPPVIRKRRVKENVFPGQIVFLMSVTPDIRETVYNKKIYELDIQIGPRVEYISQFPHETFSIPTRTGSREAFQFPVFKIYHTFKNIRQKDFEYIHYTVLFTKCTIYHKWHTYMV